MNKQKEWNKNDVFPWGKYKGKTLMSVMLHHVNYITWCMENVAGFVLDNETYKTYEAFAETPYLNSHIHRE